MIVQRALSYVVVPCLIGGAIASLVGLHGRVDDGAAASIVWIGTFIALVVLERLMPHERAWLASDGQLGADFGHTFLGSVVGSRAGTLAVDACAVGVVVVAGPTAAHVWPASLPIVAQIAIVYVGLDLVRYGQHRAQHRVDWLWQTHELHHDARRLLAVKTGRSHMLDRAMQALCAAPFIVVGAPRDVVLWCVAVNSLVGLIAHANIDARLGVLGFVVVGPEQHRVHHSRASEHHHANFGASLMLWDHAFQTAVVAPVRETGLPSTTPEGFVAQLAAPIASWIKACTDRRSTARVP